MQDPKQEVKEVIERLVCRPTREEIGETLHTFFTPDVRFYNFYLDVENGGRKDLTALLVLADWLFNYQAVHFYSIVYDVEANAVAVHMRVHMRPWLLFYRETSLAILTLFELQDHTSPDGSILKLIKVQRDFSNRSPAISLLPILGHLYSWVWLRGIISNVILLMVRFLKIAHQMLHPYQALEIFFEANQAAKKAF